MDFPEIDRVVCRFGWHLAGMACPHDSFQALSGRSVKLLDIGQVLHKNIKYLETKTSIKTEVLQATDPDFRPMRDVVVASLVGLQRR